MKSIAHEHHPLMRTERLVIDELPDEVLVYDLDHDQAHCLNKTVALVWQHCDGRTASAEIAQRLQDELQAHCPEDYVWLALRQLKKINLLDDGVVLPAPPTRMSRRQLVRTLGLAAAVAAPIVTSIVAPTSAQAATCATSGQACDVKPCCAGCVCLGTPQACVGSCG
jgi:hypothetical protein